jgi:hypothetical protein
MAVCLESNTTISFWDLGILAAVCLDLGIRLLIPLLLISSSEPHFEQQTTFGDSLQHFCLVRTSIFAAL